MERISLAALGVIESARLAAKVLEQGGVVLYPTDTLYGLAADWTNAEAVRKLYAVKARDVHKPVSIVVLNIAAIETLVVLTPQARALAERFLPGALTLVAPGQGSGERIGVRIPDDEFCKELSQTFGKPFTATSANISGEPACTTVDAILAQFGARASGIDLVIDDGERGSSMPSTVVSFMTDMPEIVREGAIPKEKLGL